MSDDVQTSSLTRIRQLIHDRELSVREVVDASLAAIEQRNGSLRAVIEVVDTAREQAKALDGSSTLRDRPLFGIPFSVKDVMTVAGVRCTCGSAARVGSAPAQRTSDAITAARAAGAVLIATTNLYEWAGGPNSKNMTFGDVVNPVDPSLTPGGSSGGSGAAVMSGMGYFSLGTDTGGSSRIPAACVGAVAWKPTPGLISTRGVFPVAPTLDTIGPIAREIADLRWIMDAFLGEAAPEPVGTIRLGVEEAYFFDAERTSSNVTSPVRDLLARAESAGAKVVPMKIPALRWAMAAEKVIMLAEWAWMHSHGQRAQRPLYGPDIQRFLSLGDVISAEFYLDAMRVRELVTAQLVGALSTVDAFITPTLPCEIPGKDQLEVEWSSGVSETILDATWRFTLPANVAGLPAVVFNLGGSTSDRSVPASAQLLGAPGRDRRLQVVAEHLSALVAR